MPGGAALSWAGTSASELAGVGGDPLIMARTEGGVGPARSKASSSASTATSIARRPAGLREGDGMRLRADCTMAAGEKSLWRESGSRAGDCATRSAGGAGLGAVGSWGGVGAGRGGSPRRNAASFFCGVCCCAWGGGGGGTLGSGLSARDRGCGGCARPGPRDALSPLRKVAARVAALVGVASGLPLAEVTGVGREEVARRTLPAAMSAGLALASASANVNGGSVCLRRTEGVPMLAGERRRPPPPPGPPKRKGEPWSVPGEAPWGAPATATAVELAAVATPPELEAAEDEPARASPSGPDVAAAIAVAAICAAGERADMLRRPA